MVVALCAGQSEVNAQVPAFVSKFKPLIDDHCIDCHGPDVQKANLRLDTLKTDLSDERSLAAWTLVHDKLAAGEMPPPKRERPSANELKTAINFLNKDLHAASLARQQQKGRVIGRRLNGTEYENTIRDLMGTNVSVKEMLPEDGSVAGFDNVSAALELSSTHLLLYQEAAEKAVLSTIPVHPPIPFSDRRTAKQMVERGPNFNQTLTRSCILKGDDLIVYSKLPRYGLCSSNPVPSDGRYKVQMSIAAVGESGKPFPVGIFTVGTGREDPVLVETREIAHGEPKVIELEIDLKRRQSFVVNMMIHWDIRATKKSIEEHKGPGFHLQWIKIDGPIDPWPPLPYKNLFADVPMKARSAVKAEMEGGRIPKISDNRPEQQWQNDPLVPASAKPKEDADRLIRAILPRAFRRPVDEELTRQFIKRVHDKLDQKYTFLDAMVYGYKSILSSPHFLLFMEPGAPTLKADTNFHSTKLDDYALASRLSYFLWSTYPDEELLAIANKGELSRPDVLRGQVERMLKSPNAHRFTENFTGQWLDLRKIAATIPDPQLYGDFDQLLLHALPLETELFFEEILKNDLSLLEFVDSDWTMLNERLAKHYGIPGVEGHDFRKVKLPPESHRGGVMTQASILKVTADGTRTSPVLRGKWVLEKIIGKPPAPPPPDVPAIEPDIRGATTIRQQLDKHRTIATCASCHVHIDPPGFALENFDPIGGYREFYRASARTTRGFVSLPNYTGRPIWKGPDVEKGGVTHDGHKFDNIEDYKKLLLADKDQLARNLTQKLLIYSTGADIQYADREVVEEIVAKIKNKNHGFRTLVHEVVQSRVFLNK